MILITIALLIIAVIAFAAYPLFQRTDELDVVFVGATDPMWENLVTQRDATYGAIKDLENDHTMGKLSDVDYRTLRAKYETKAVTILQELDGLVGKKPSVQTNSATDDDIEREIVSLRRAPKNGKLECPTCGAPHLSEDVFCAKCGTSLKGIRCPSCGQRATVGDKFCAKCGTAIN
ncbi:MAG: zinc ribbon domain-containing protein [Chloroflexi bacterium]|nr:zinc ribbon domain-containing protein [Chloroflexota bacterium]